MDKNDNIFEFEEYLKRSLGELNVTVPPFEECARVIIEDLCLEIIKNKRDSFDITKEIFKVTVEIDNPLELSVWNELDDGVDRIFYDDEYYKPDERELRERIKLEARRYLASQDSEGIR
ncbi:hypothetical protein [Paenibacillus sp. XY044]|uniref:hypothetical protein n=1 Tax=Paenibacillus sp. XY044 TaxID=2026089 RepID=UPI000B992BC7|nr:hypothetical protein [Paenibacillus sp. XY044]OZB96148.1 hypothetical protein CJP46_09550 [Paenibacillus sp. XY044]